MAEFGAQATQFTGEIWCVVCGQESETSSLVSGPIREAYDDKCLVSGNSQGGGRGAKQGAGKSTHREKIQEVWLVPS